MKKYLLLGFLLVCSQYGLCKEETGKAFARPGLHFLENKGQVKDEHGRERQDIDFVLRGNGVSVFVGEGKISYQWVRPGKSGKLRAERMDIRLDGARKNTRVVKEGQQPFLTRFCKDGRTFSPNAWSKVTYQEVYKGIDWVLYLKEGMMEYDFVVRDGADPSQIKLGFEGDVKLSMNNDGSIIARTSSGVVKQHQPYSFTTDGKTVASSYRLKKKTVQFDVAEYEGTLVIDPVLVWGTYYGGVSNDSYECIASDGLGNIYAGGTTLSTTGISTNTTTLQGQEDAMLSKFDVNGNLVWTTYFGTAGNDEIIEIAVDEGNAVYAIGNIDTSGSQDVFVAKFDTSGNAISSLHMGGALTETGFGISLDSSANVYICGWTSGWLENTTGCYQPAYGGGTHDAFLAKLSNQLTVQWCTYYGGSGQDALLGVAAQPFGKINVSGTSTSNNAIATTGTTQVMNGGGMDGVVAQFDANTGTLNWGTYLGGTQMEEAIGVGFDGAGNVYACGHTGSTTGIATTGAYQDTWAGMQDGFVAKYNSSGVIQWSTYYGGTNSEYVYDLQVTAHDVLVAAFSSSSNMDVTNGFQTVFGGSTDGIVAKYNKNTGSFTWGTYYGGNDGDMLMDITTDIYDNIYVAGRTASTNNISLNTAVQPALAGGNDGFIARIDDCNILVQPTAITGDDTACAGTSQTYSVPPIPFASLYIWTLPGGWTGNSFTETITTTVGANSGPVTMYAFNGCDTTTVITLNVTVNPLPIPVITQAGGTLSTTVYSAYQWYNGATPISGATGQSYTPTQGGNYHVAVTDVNGCIGISNSIPVSVNNVAIASGISLYPNPVTGSFTINGAFRSGDGKVTAEVIDIAGRLVLREQVLISGNNISAKINLDAALPAGVYTLRLSSDMQNAVIPFVQK